MSRQPDYKKYQWGKGGINFDLKEAWTTTRKLEDMDGKAWHKADMEVVAHNKGPQVYNTSQMHQWGTQQRIFAAEVNNQSCPTIDYGNFAGQPVTIPPYIDHSLQSDNAGTTYQGVKVGYNGFDTTKYPSITFTCTITQDILLMHQV